MAQLTDTMRPDTLDGVIGNEHIKDILRGQFESNNIAHTFLLIGQYGAGKTTIARIIANQLDAEVIEHDAGAKSDIDTIRALVDTAYSTSLFSDSKVYIFDEVHKLSKDAQTVLLKITEEPPEDVYFILCTSEEDKVIPALASRAIKLKVDPVGVKGIRTLVDTVSEKLNITVENRQDWMKVVNKSEGSIRVVYNLIDSLFAAGEKKDDGSTYISTKVFDSIISGDVGMDEETPLVKCVLGGDLVGAFKAIDSHSRAGDKPYSICFSLYRYIRKASLLKHKALLADLALILYDKDRANSWEGLEHVLLKNL